MHWLLTVAVVWGVANVVIVGGIVWLSRRGTASRDASGRSGLTGARGDGGGRAKGPGGTGRPLARRPTTWR